MLQLARTRRLRRNGEWTAEKAVTFIVTLAAQRSVTLAAARAGMSRKSAYALRDRDPAFAAAWESALAAAAPTPAKSKVDTKVYNPPIAPPVGDSVTLRGGRSLDAKMRDLFFANLANRRSDSGPRTLARGHALP